MHVGCLDCTFDYCNKAAYDDDDDDDDVHYRELEEQIRSNEGERRAAGCRAVVTVSLDQAPSLPSSTTSKKARFSYKVRFENKDRKKSQVHMQMLWTVICFAHYTGILIPRPPLHPNRT